MAQVEWGRIELVPPSASLHTFPVQVLELLELCRAHMSALVHDDELVVSASLGQLQAGCRHSLCGSLSLPWRECADR